MRIAIVLVVLVSVAGCTPMRSRRDPPYPYQGQMHLEAKMREIAAEECGLSQNTEAEPGIHPFTTDGCTAWRDSRWLECCIEHDIRYWCTSTGVSRKEADRALRDCVLGHSNATNAFLIYWGTRLGGASWLPFSWRWGYGYSWLAIPSTLKPATPEPESEAGERTCE